MSAFELHWEPLHRKGVDDEAIKALWKEAHPQYADQADLPPETFAHWKACLSDG